VRSAYPDQRIYTWWNRRGDFYESDRGWRLDHILVDSATARQVAGVAVDRSERGRSGSSDHAPVFFDLTAVTTL